ncbi:MULTISPECIES: NADH-quinone oxidoreductase subunit N [Methylobacterium]|uniref:NADH-quinone oxidoreductase subunit N n=2 Tax=Methylobacterium TaxID=407 RepID=A0AAJ1WZD6_9HYPH|nr:MULTISPECIES: NADH-quinone oxidoreductase subunit N [Methylobacterium]MDH2312577.1 NADH-quinone oxidoreductase subunit N [Methylobacterium brachiatum]MDQ0546850.1 NADH-quinone oxidoreductase subunit N [Methylobacterium brachiatum]
MDLGAVAPEMALAGTALALVPVAGWVRGRWRRLPAAIALLALLVAMGLTAPMLTAPPREAFCSTYAVDPFRGFYQLVIEVGALLSLLSLAPYFRAHEQEPQYPVALLMATVGGMGLTAATDLGLIVLFLQMVSFPSYLLVLLVRSDKPAQEATLKYFLYGAAALAVMAYGLTFLFGLTGSLNLRAIGVALAGADRAWVALAFGLVIVGYGFEMTLVPFHVWAPDVFQGGTAPVSGFVSVVPKVAAFAGLLRFLLEAMPNGLAAWPTVLALMSAATMTFGNLVALRQTNLKRLLAYSSIAQAGYMLMAVAVAGQVPEALPAIGYYLVAYLLMNLAAFAVVAQVERMFGSDSLTVVRGFGRRAPWSAAAFTLALLSLAGVPPLAGFAGKVFLLLATIDGGLIWLAVLAAANMALALYYYVAVIAEMYFRRPEHSEPAASGAGYIWPIGLCTAGTLASGIIPGLVDKLAHFGSILLR